MESIPKLTALGALAALAALASGGRAEAQTASGRVTTVHVTLAGRAQLLPAPTGSGGAGGITSGPNALALPSVMDAGSHAVAGSFVSAPGAQRVEMRLEGGATASASSAGTAATPDSRGSLDCPQNADGSFAVPPTVAGAIRGANDAHVVYVVYYGLDGRS